MEAEKTKTGDTAQAAEKTAPVKKKNHLKLKVGGVILVVLIGLGIYHLMHLGEVSTDDAAIESTVSTISPKVAGYIIRQNITDNQDVKAGETLIEIDPADYKIRVERAQAQLDAAKARVGAAGKNLETAKVAAPSNIDSAKATVIQTQANWDNAKKNLQRIKSLSDEARSVQQLDNAVTEEAGNHAAYDSAVAQLRNAESAPNNVAAAEANKAELAAGVKQAEAELAQAEKDLADTKVIAPIAGRITNRGVARGDYIQPGQQLFSLVGRDIYVIANFKETQLRHMLPGQLVSVHADATPDADILGKVDSIQTGTGSRFSAFPAQNATGNFVKIVQRVPVKIILTRFPKDTILGPGMSIVPTVYTR